MRKLNFREVKWLDFPFPLLGPKQLSTHVYLYRSASPPNIIIFTDYLGILNTMHPSTCFPYSWVHTPAIMPSPPPHKKNKNHTKFNLCFPYTHWIMVKLLVASPLKKSESCPNPTSASSPLLWRATLQNPYSILKSSLLGLLSRFFFLYMGGVKCEGGGLLQKPLSL